jgi:hypothetical protein
LVGCRIPTLRAYQLETRGDVDLDRTTTNWMDIFSAHVGGTLGLNGVTLTGDRDGNALNASRIRVDGDMSCRELTLRGGELRLIDGHIGGELNLNGATLANAGGPALRGDGLQVDAGIWASHHDSNAFRADGELRLIGANAGRQLNLSGARLDNRSGAALNADRVHVGGDAIFEQVVVGGEIRIVAASIAGQLRFGGARIMNLRALGDAPDAPGVERGRV